MSLFSPFTVRDLTFPNRLMISPMCQFTVRDGMVGDYHLVHLGRFALGGFGSVMVEATGVTPEGRISYGCTGLWKDEQIQPYARIVDFLHAEGTVAGIQLAHAGRKASTLPPWLYESKAVEPGAENWQPVAPSAEPHDADSLMPRALELSELPALVDAFADAAKRSLTANFDFVEIHAAHGYLLNQFLSPVANHRDDAYGGSQKNRMRLVLEIIEAVRGVWPDDRPLFMRVSAVDGRADGIQIEDSVELARLAKSLGVDVIDVSATGFTGASVPQEPGQYGEFSRQIRDQAEIATMSVGMIADPKLAQDIIDDGRADLVAIARAALDDPNWARHARHMLESDATDIWNKQAGFAIQRWPLRQTVQRTD